MPMFGSAPFSTVTTYRKDYTGKICPKRPLTEFHPGLPNPVVGALEEHVLPRYKYEQLPPTQTKYPDPKAYAEEVAEKYPSTRVFLREPTGALPDLDVIDKYYEDENKSVYMISYCETEDYESKNARARRRQRLPDDWIIPLTTYRCSYRPPELLVPGGIPKIIRIPQDKLKPSMRQREILEVTTGETTYGTDISNTGAEIIKGKLHGDVSIRPQFDPEDLLKTKLLRRD